MSSTPPFWRADLSWRTLQDQVRDGIPEDWMVSPLAAGWHLLAVQSPTRKERWDAWVGGDQPAPRAMKVNGIEYPAHPVARLCWERAQSSPGDVLLFGIPGSALAVGTEVYEEGRVRAEPGLVLEMVVGIIKAWEACRRPERAWSTRTEQAAARRARDGWAVEQARVRAEQQRAMQLREAELAKQRRARVSRRGHYHQEP